MNTSNDKPYVFISYAHIDSGTVLPIIDAMKSSGILVWYDEGIEAGSEWPEYIAEKVMCCNKFLLFISPAYLESQNCKRELNFAISRKKDILSVYLQDVELSPGMEMQLGTYQAVFRKRFASLNLFCQSLCQEKFFAECRNSFAKGSAAQAAAGVNSANTVQFDSSFKTNGNISGHNFDELFGQFFTQSTKVAVDSNGKFTSPSPATPQPTAKSNAKAIPVKSRKVAALLAIFLGHLGIQRFYLRQYLLGVLSILFCWTYIPAIIGFIEGIVLLCSSNQKFEKKYKCIATK